MVSVRDVVSDFSLKWGDKIELLGIIKAFKENSRLYPKSCGSLPLPFSAVCGKRFSPIKLDSSATVYKRQQDIEERTLRTLKQYTNCAEFKEMHKIAASSQVKL